MFLEMATFLREDLDSEIDKDQRQLMAVEMRSLNTLFKSVHRHLQVFSIHNYHDLGKMKYDIDYFGLLIRIMETEGTIDVDDIDEASKQHKVYFDRLENLIKRHEPHLQERLTFEIEKYNNGVSEQFKIFVR